MTTLARPPAAALSEERSDPCGHPSPPLPDPGAPRGARLELFVCHAVSGKLTRSSCAKRHHASKRKAPKKGRNGGMDMRLYAAACESCPIGAAHARGETPMRWPNGSAIELVASPVRLVSAPLAALPEPEPGVKTKSKPKAATRSGRRPRDNVLRVTCRGRTLSLIQWGAEPEIAALGLSHDVLRWRLSHGWSVEAAFTTRVGEFTITSRACPDCGVP